MDAGDARWLAERYALGAVQSGVRVARGAMGEVYDLVADAGRFAAKRYAGSGHELPEAQFSRRFADICRAAGVRCPRSRPAADGALLTQDVTGRWWQLAQWVGGSRPTPDDRASAEWLAEQTGRIHALAIAPGWSARLDPFYAESRVDWPELLRATAAAGSPWAPALDARVRDFEQLADWAREQPVGELIVSHNDLTLDNVLASPAGRSIIDWDNAGPQDPAREIGVQLLPWLADTNAVRQIVGSYEGSLGARLHWDVSIFASAVNIWLNFTALQLELANGGADPARGEYAHSRLGALLHDLPSLAALTSMAAAVPRGPGGR